jgi:2-methylfumaryl-CoA hydratase
MQKQFAGNFFEDFSLGQTIVHGTPRTLTSGDAALYIALTGSRHVLHCAAPVARSLGLREQTADDLLAFHIGFGKTVADISLNAVANLGYADVRFLKPVYAGDTLRSESTVIGLKENASGQNGNVYVRSTTLNQYGEEVLSWIRWVMVHKRDPASPAPQTIIPELPAAVAPDRLPIPEQINAEGFETSLTGSPHLWEDYAIGERIDHLDGLTIDETDHTLATKLYQNTARLHFDEHMMRDSRFGRRLMYGGHVISVCRALSYNGLANAVKLLAINAGTHVNPTFAGDTLYAYSEVLDKWALPGRRDLGALRLRTLGIKNLESQAIAAPKIERDGKLQYHENLVLDLDYWVLMPRSPD